MSLRDLRIKVQIEPNRRNIPFLMPGKPCQKAETWSEIWKIDVALPKSKSRPYLLLIKQYYSYYEIFLYFMPYSSI